MLSIKLNFESYQHLFFSCPTTVKLWKVLCEWFCHARPPDNLVSLIRMKEEKSPLLAGLWKAGSLSLLVDVWKMRNRQRYDDVQPNYREATFRIKKAVELAYMMIPGSHYGSDYDKKVLLNLNLQVKRRQPETIIECYWLPPPHGMIKANSDGASHGNPGQAGWRVIFRNHGSAVKGVYFGGLGKVTNYEAECAGIIEAMDKAKEKGWDQLWVETDSVAAARAFNSGKPHWTVQQRYVHLKNWFKWLLITSTKREAKFVADACAAKGVHLPIGRKEWFSNSSMPKVPLENSFSVYFRFH